MSFQTLVPRLGAMIVIATALAATSCNNGRLTTYPVTGQVFYNGAPLKGVSLAFHPVDPKVDIGYPAHGKTDEQGRFKLTSYLESDGAPAGDYKVALAFEVDAVEEGSDQSRKLTFQLPAKYHRKETTDISATVKKGASDLEPFKLEGPPMPTSR